MTPDLERALLAQAETGDAIHIDLDAGTWAIGRGPIVEPPEMTEPERREPVPRDTPMARTLRALWELL